MIFNLYIYFVYYQLITTLPPNIVSGCKGTNFLPNYLINRLKRIVEQNKFKNI